MKDFKWSTKDRIVGTDNIMNQWLENFCSYDVINLDDDHAEILDNGVKYIAIASGDGDFFNHKVSFKHVK